MIKKLLFKAIYCSNETIFALSSFQSNFAGYQGELDCTLRRIVQRHNKYGITWQIH